MSTVRTGKLKLTRSEKKLFLVTGCLIALILAAGLWWQWLNADPVVHIPTPQMPNPNAFDFYVKAGDALVRSNQIGDAIRVQPPGVKADPKLYPTYSLAQKQALLQMNLPALRLLHQGFAYKYQQPPERSLSSNSFPQFARFRELARLLVLEGQVKAAHGDKTGAVNSYLDAVRLGSDVQRGRTADRRFDGLCYRSNRTRRIVATPSPLGRISDTSSSKASRKINRTTSHVRRNDARGEVEWPSEAIRVHA